MTGRWWCVPISRGIDPDKDVELTVSDGLLHIQPERRGEQKHEDKGYLRQEVHYGRRPPGTLSGS